MKNQATLIRLHFKVVSYRSKTFLIALWKHHMSVSVIFSTQICLFFYNLSYLERQICQIDVNYELIDKFWPQTDVNAELIDEFFQAELM